MSSIKAITNLNLKHLIDQLKATWFIGRDEKGVAGGVATLDNDGKLTLAQSTTNPSIAMWTKGISLNQGSNVINKASVGETLTPIFINIEFFEGENTVLLNYTEVVESGCILGYNVTVTPDHDNVVAHVTYRIKEAVASQAALTSEGYAVGTQNGVEVGSSSPYYHNNAKYYSENGGSGVVVVTTSNTYAEIKNLYDSGKTIMLSTGADKKGVFLPLIKYDENNSRFIFGGATGESSNASAVITQEGSGAEQKSFMTTLNSGRSDMLKLDGSGKATYAVAGTDYQAPLSFMTAPSSSNKVATAADLAAAGGGTERITITSETDRTIYTPSYLDEHYFNQGKNVEFVLHVSDASLPLSFDFVFSYKETMDMGNNMKCYVFVCNTADLTASIAGGNEYPIQYMCISYPDSGVSQKGLILPSDPDFNLKLEYKLQEKLEFNTAYDPTTNKVATMADVGGGLTPATTSTLGGVIVGDNLAIDANGVLNALDIPDIKSSYDWITNTIVGNPFCGIYGAEKFVVIIYDSNIAAYSVDGINWTETTLSSSAFWYSVTYGNGKFVAVAKNSNKVAYSSDGITWEESTLPSSANWYSVTYGNGKFVAVAYYSDKVAYSADGVNWEESSMPLTGYYHSIAYGSGKFVTYTTSTALYSEDGANWEYTNAPGYCPDEIVYTDKRFYALGGTIDSLYSEDGINWTTERHDSIGSLKYDYHICYGAGKLIILDREWIDGGNHYRLFISEDSGDTWIEKDNVTLCCLTASCNIIYGNNLFILLYGNSSGGGKYSYWDISLRTNSPIYIGENKVATVDQIPDDIVFNTAYSASTNKAATMSDIPTTLASLSDDTTHRVVTDAQVSAWTAKADLASPTFTGVPVAPTAAAGTNTTQIATTAFVQAAVDAAINDALNASY